MNDQVRGKGLPEGGAAPDDASLRPQDLPARDLTGRDLAKIEGLLPEHLAGTILTGAKLPPEIAKFEAVAQVKAISSEARKVFIGLLAACVYSWLVIGTTTDVALILNTATSPLPIINTPIPIADFYVVGAALLATVYCYFHFYLQHLWRTLATLPAVFPDGVTLDDKTDPWLLTNLVRTEFPHLSAPAPPLARLENLLPSSSPGGSSRLPLSPFGRATCRATTSAALPGSRSSSPPPSSSAGRTSISPARR